MGCGNMKGTEGGEGLVCKTRKDFFFLIKKEVPCLLAKLVSGEVQGLELLAGPLLLRWQRQQLVSL